MAMVSGLYQRRAFGFKDYYIYGTAYHSTDQLTVYAAAWNNEGSQGETLSKDTKIMLYELDTFETASPSDMIRYYLLMRLSRHLALGYKASLERIKYNDVSKLLRKAKGLGSWPPEPDSLPHRDIKRRRTSPIREDGGLEVLLNDLMPDSSSLLLPNTRDNDQESHGAAMKNPLKRQFVDILNRKGQ
ncbi:hypothetical protein B0J17DRAFT_720664 [Rhizoctonia solani]|nr:hypothetical protein B0J17DRAFT_720664 [Rhizoctonia solani]